MKPLPSPLPRARRLAAIAKWINANRPELRATIDPWTTNTDRKIGRLRWPGRGRKGYRLRVSRVGGNVILEHTSGETYRTNAEVESWLETYLTKCLKGKHRGFWPSSTECETCGSPCHAGTP